MISLKTHRDIATHALQSPAVGGKPARDTSLQSRTQVRSGMRIASNAAGNAARTLSRYLAALLWVLAGCSSTPSTGDPRNRLDHVAISVANARASADFYQAAFGFAELKTPFGEGADVVWLDLGGGIALHVFGGRSSDAPNDRERHLALAVADMSKVTSFLASRAIQWQNFEGVHGEMQTRPDGVHQMFFRDPDGYWVEVNDALKAARR